MAIEGKSGSIYLVQFISCLSCASACAYNGNPHRYTDHRCLSVWTHIGRLQQEPPYLGLHCLSSGFKRHKQAIFVALAF